MTESGSLELDGMLLMRRGFTIVGALSLAVAFTDASPLRVAVAGDACVPSVCTALLRALSTAGTEATRLNDTSLMQLNRIEFFLADLHSALPVHI